MAGRRISTRGPDVGDHAGEDIPALLPEDPAKYTEDWRDKVPLQEGADDPEVQAAVVPDPEAPDEEGEFHNE